MITSKPCNYRLMPIYWTIHRLGLPKGFKDTFEWTQWITDVLDSSGLDEEFIQVGGISQGYLAYQEGYCIHHKGKVLDIQMLVLSPYCKETRQVWKSILESAKRNGYSWVARRQHQPDGSIKTIFTEV